MTQRRGRGRGGRNRGGGGNRSRGGGGGNQNQNQIQNQSQNQNNNHNQFPSNNGGFFNGGGAPAASGGMAWGTGGAMMAPAMGQGQGQGQAPMGGFQTPGQTQFNNNNQFNHHNHNNQRGGGGGGGHRGGRGGGRGGGTAGASAGGQHSKSGLKLANEHLAFVNKVALGAPVSCVVVSQGPETMVFAGCENGAVHCLNMVKQTKSALQVQGPVTTLCCEANWLFVGFTVTQPGGVAGLVHAFNLALPTPAPENLVLAPDFPAAARGPISSMCVGGTFLLVASLDGSVCAWAFNASKWERVGTYGAPAAHTNGVPVLRVIAFDAFSCTTAQNGEIKLWDIASGQALKTIVHAPGPAAGGAPHAPPRVVDVKFMVLNVPGAAGKFLFSLGEDNSLCIWNLDADAALMLHFKPPNLPNPRKRAARSVLISPVALKTQQPALVWGFDVRS